MRNSVLTGKKWRVILRDRVEMTPSTAWRDGRVDDCDGLENRSRQQPTEGSNPSPSALVLPSVGLTWQQVGF